MAARRVFFCLVLCGALLFHIMTESYWGQFLVVLCAVLPVLSLALSFRGMRGCAVTLAAVPPSLPLGTEGHWQIAVRVPGPLPLSRMDMRCVEENLLLGRTQRRTVRLTGAAEEQFLTLPACTEHCGLLELRVQRVRVYDLLGLFCCRLPLPAPARMVCLPLPTDEQPPRVAVAGPMEAVRIHTAPAGTAEDYDLRGYRPGDPIRAVHWKLSTKWDSLIVREPVRTHTALPLLLLDRFGTAETLDPLLGRLYGLCRALLSVQQPHRVLWLDAAAQPCQFDVADERQLLECLMAVLGSAAPRTGEGIALDGHPELWETAGGTVIRIGLETEGGGADA